MDFNLCDMIQVSSVYCRMGNSFTSSSSAVVIKSPDHSDKSTEDFTNDCDDQSLNLSSSSSSSSSCFSLGKPEQSAQSDHFPESRSSSSLTSTTITSISTTTDTTAVSSQSSESKQSVNCDKIFHSNGYNNDCNSESLIDKKNNAGEKVIVDSYLHKWTDYQQPSTSKPKKVTIPSPNYTEASYLKKQIDWKDWVENFEEENEYEFKEIDEDDYADSDVEFESDLRRMFLENYKETDEFMSKKDSEVFKSNEWKEFLRVHTENHKEAKELERKIDSKQEFKSDGWKNFSRNYEEYHKESQLLEEELLIRGYQMNSGDIVNQTEQPPSSSSNMSPKTQLADRINNVFDRRNRLGVFTQLLSDIMLTHDSIPFGPQSLKKLTASESDSTDDEDEINNKQPKQILPNTAPREDLSELVIPRTQRIGKDGKPIEEKCTCHHHQVATK